MCGTEDLLIEHNRRFVDAARASGLTVTTDFSPGEHEWGLWDAQLPAVLDFIAGHLP